MSILLKCLGISIHALRGEGDYSRRPQAPRIRKFQSTPSVGRATAPPSESVQKTTISIHALRGEGDYCRFHRVFNLTISIHALRGEGDCQAYRQSTAHSTFQSTPSVGRATIAVRFDRHFDDISIHALRGEGDAIALYRLRETSYFNPRPPWGGRPIHAPIPIPSIYFNPRPPWGGRRTSDRQNTA